MTIVSLKEETYGPGPGRFGSQCVQPHLERRIRQQLSLFVVQSAGLEVDDVEGAWHGLLDAVGSSPKPQ
nr:hypothetical protein [Myxococcus sp. AB056]